MPHGRLEGCDFLRFSKLSMLLNLAILSLLELFDHFLNLLVKEEADQILELVTRFAIMQNYFIFSFVFLGKKHNFSH